MIRLKTIRDFDLKGKIVLIRCDFNVPMKDREILDDTRIRASLPTIQYALKEGAKIVLFSHLGRIKEEKDLDKNSLAPVAASLEKLLSHPVTFVPETRGKGLEEAIANLKEQDIVLVQNTRYEDLNGKKESNNDEELGTYWASLGDIFINDAFGTAHRSHASNVGIASHLPSGIGFLIEKELEHLELVKHPEHPFVVLLGGSKVQDKIGILQSLVVQADYLLIGGGMAYTFLKEEGYEIGTSLLDQENLSFCHELLSKYENKIILPVDHVISRELSDTSPREVVSTSEIPTDQMGLDIGPKTVELFERYLKNAKTILWNGPVGAYEFSRFQKGTNDLLTYLSNLSSTTVIGGGDTAAAATLLGVADKMTHVATGGGATLEYLEGKPLPGISIIEMKCSK